MSTRRSRLRPPQAALRPERGLAAPRFSALLPVRDGDGCDRRCGSVAARQTRRHLAGADCAQRMARPPALDASHQRRHGCRRKRALQAPAWPVRAHHADAYRSGWGGPCSICLTGQRARSTAQTSPALRSLRPEKSPAQAERLVVRLMDAATLGEIIEMAPSDHDSSEHIRAVHGLSPGLVKLFGHIRRPAAPALGGAVCGPLATAARTANRRFFGAQSPIWNACRRVWVRR